MSDTSDLPRNAEREKRVPWWSSPACWVAAIFVAPTILALGARYWWPLELCSHFAVQYACLLLPVLVWLLVRRRIVFSIVAAGCLIWNVVLIAPSYMSEAWHGAEGPGIRLVVANLLSRNRDHQKFLDFVIRERPDVILVMEINDQWAESLGELKTEYPYSKVVPRSDNFGIAILSKIPLKEVEVRDFDRAHIPSIQCRFDLDGGEVTFIGTHPLPPMGRAAESRNKHLARIAEVVAEIEGPVIVAGDLNITPWSPWFDDLLRKSSLRDTRRGFGIQPTWPSPFGPCGIPIDHVLTSPDLIATDRYVGQHVGSDHRPVVADVAFAKVE